MSCRRFVAILCLLICHCSLGFQLFEPLPPDPNNAALLYYQAILLYPEPDEIVEKLLYDPNLDDLSHFCRTGECREISLMKKKVQRYENNFGEQGVDLKAGDSFEEVVEKVSSLLETLEPNESSDSSLTANMGDGLIIFDQRWSLESDLTDYIEKRELLDQLSGRNLKTMAERHLRKAEDAIDCVEAASCIPFCDWGYRYSLGTNSRRTSHLSGLRSLARLFIVDSLRYAAKGDRQMALERCLTIRRMVNHVGDDSMIPYLAAISTDALACNSIRYILPEMVDDVQVLTSLKEGLLQHCEHSLSFSSAYKREFQLFLKGVMNNDKFIEKFKETVDLRNELIQSGEKSTIRSFIEGIAQPTKDYILKCSTVLEDPNKKYFEKYVLLKKLQERFEFGQEQYSYSLAKDAYSSPENLLRRAIAQQALDISHIYTMSTRHRASVGLTLNAIEVHLYYCKHGEWPKMLPAGSPKNPFNGEDYYYRASEKGFILRWDEGVKKEIPERKRSYEFVLKD